MKRMLGIAGLVLACAALFGCGDTSDYTVKRHLKYCDGIADGEDVTGKARNRMIDKCMGARGHVDWDHDAYLAKKKAKEKGSIGDLGL